MTNINPDEIIKLEQKHYAPVYQKLPLIVEKGLGARIWDVDGREYIDCMAGYGVALVGHCNPKVVGAVRDQLDRIITAHSSLYNRARSELLEKLSSIAPKGLDTIFLSSSGAEANECAFKLARKHTGRSEIVAFTGGYHGKTVGALSVTWAKKYRDPFESMLPKVKFARYGEIESARELINRDTAAVFVEPVQGESGVQIPTSDFLPQLRELCDQSGALLIIDEVQTGLGRTGRMWASEHWNVTPDIMTVAKGLAGGLPFAATLSTREIMSSLKLGEHSSTFGGNPLCCAAGTATINYILENNLPAQAERKGILFLDGLRKIMRENRILRDVRGLGLMLAAESRFDVHEPLLECIKRGLLATYSGRNIIRLLPLLVIEEDQIQKAVSILGESLPKIENTVQAV